MPGEASDINQEVIEDLLRQAQMAAGQTPAPISRGAVGEPVEPRGVEMPSVSAPTRASSVTTTASAPRPEAARARSGNVGDDINFLIEQAQQAIASVDHPVDPALAGIAPFQLHDFAGTPPSGDKATLELLKDVDLDLRIELGRTQMYLEDVLKLKRGSVVPLEKLAGDPVDIYVNGRLIARGEVLVLNDNFCVRVAELLSGDDVP